MLAYNDLYGLHHFWQWYYPYKVFAWTFLYGDGYQFWSGVGLVVFLPLVYAWHHNCHVKGCWRLGHIDPVNHHPACHIHHSHGHLTGVAPSIAQLSPEGLAELKNKSGSQ